MLPPNKSEPAHDDHGRLSASDPNDCGSRVLAEPDTENAPVTPEGSDCNNEKSSETSSSSPPLFKVRATAFSPDPELPTNERLLGTAFFTFLIFALVQITFAVIAGSKAMMGDSAAMIVDSMNYLFNWAAERRKNRFDELNANADHNNTDDDVVVDPVRAAFVRQRNRRKLILQLEIIPPVISVMALVVVTATIIKSAVDALQDDGLAAVDSGTGTDQQQPNIYIMMGFSSFNLLLDFVNVFCFARAKHLLGYATRDDATVKEDADFCDAASSSYPPTTTAVVVKGNGTGERNIINHGVDDAAAKDEGKEGDEEDDFPIDTVHGSSGSTEDGNDVEDQTPCVDLGCVFVDVAHIHSPSTSKHEHPQQQQRANLNMCSAYTHVFADTLRSIAVIIAAGLAMIFPDKISPVVADATAALVVSTLILLSLLPLVGGLWGSTRMLCGILAQERSERILVVAAARNNN